MRSESKRFSRRPQSAKLVPRQFVIGKRSSWLLSEIKLPKRRKMRSRRKTDRKSCRIKRERPWYSVQKKSKTCHHFASNRTVE